ncbi:helix-turn-helix domain-containing protein [Nocardia concava]|uniref:helix-turn-helix domain-containing protein n=1 Tax=Nocardia concava TaxID=257281 RepID=UPI00031BCBF9|nr:helix-turn-helix domain-containing protein [Nocardia concava]
MAPTSESSNKPQPPALGLLLRRLRADRHASREKLAFAAGVSTSYIARLESGHREHPTHAVIEALTRCLEIAHPLSPPDRRHLRDLAGLTDERIPNPAELRAELADDLHTYLELQQPHPAAYLDIRWNLLAANDSCAATFPGLVENGNLMRWIFGDPRAKHTLPEWKREAKSAAAVLRGWVGRHSHAPWVAELLDELGTYPAFQRSWAANTVEFVRRRPALVRDPGTADIRHLHPRVFRATSENYPDLIYLFLGAWGSIVEFSRGR